MILFAQSRSDFHCMILILLYFKRNKCFKRNLLWRNPAPECRCMVKCKPALHDDVYDSVKQLAIDL